MGLCSRQSLQCHFLLELGTVTPSLMYLFVLHIRVLVDYTHACCATQAKGGLYWCPKFRGHYSVSNVYVRCYIYNVFFNHLKSFISDEKVAS